MHHIGWLNSRVGKSAPFSRLAFSILLVLTPQLSALPYADEASSVEKRNDVRFGALLPFPAQGPNSAGFAKALDQDGDGIDDDIDGTDDLDSDGLPNYLDTDSDGDGLTDAAEGTDDFDNDGKGNWIDADSDNDGVDDKTETFKGTDPYNSADTPFLPFLLNVENIRDEGAIDDSEAFVMSADGRHVYVALYGERGGVSAFSRDNATGRLAHLQTLWGQRDGVPPMHEAYYTALSPDDKFVYVSAYGSNTIVVFSRDGVRGLLTYSQFIGGIPGPGTIVFSPDGSHAYVGNDAGLWRYERDTGTGTLSNPQSASVASLPAHMVMAPAGDFLYAGLYSDNAIQVFSRDVDTGSLASVQVFQDVNMGLDFGLRRPYGMALSPDGAQLYVANVGVTASGAPGVLTGSIVVFNRNVTTGVLTWVQAVQDDSSLDLPIPFSVGDGLERASSLAVSPDGERVYATSWREDSLAVFSRNVDTGELAFDDVYKSGVNGVYGLDTTTNVLVSPDNDFVYVLSASSDRIAVFDEQPAKSLFVEIQSARGPEGRPEGFDEANVALSPDGRHVYAVSLMDDLLTAYTRDTDTGTLTHLQTLVDAENGITGLDGASGMAVSPDGKHVYIAGGEAINRQANGTYAVTTGALAAFERELTTGELTFIEVERDGVNGVDGLAGARDVLVSPDGKHVYAAASADHAVSVFSRDETTGALTFIEAKFDPTIGDSEDLEFAQVLGMTPNGRYLLVGGRTGGNAIFQRDPDTGALTQENSGGLAGTAFNDLTFGPLSRGLYGTLSTGSSGIIYGIEFDQESGNSGGDLSILSTGLNAGRTAITPTGSHLIVPTDNDEPVPGNGNCLYLFFRNQGDGALTPFGSIDRGLFGVEGLVEPDAVEVSPSGGHVYVVGSDNNWDGSLQVLKINADSAPPAVTVEQAAGQADPVRTLPIRFDIEFSEPVTPISDPALGVMFTGSAAVTAFTLVDAVTGLPPAPGVTFSDRYTLTVTNATEGAVVPGIPAFVALDAANNANSLPSSSVDNLVTFDYTKPPAPVITTHNGVNFITNQALLTLEGTTANDTFTVRVNSSSDAVSYTPGASSWSASLPLAEGSNPFAVTAMDAAGNESPPASILVALDTVPPSVGLSGPSAALANTGPVTFEVAFSGEDITSIAFGSSDVTLHATGSANGTVSVVEETFGLWTVEIVSISGDGALAISIAGGVATDAAGNASLPVGPSATFIVDNTPPGVALSSPTGAVTNVSPIPVSANFSEPVNLTAGAITTTNAAVANFSGGGAAYTFDLVPAGQGAVEAAILGGALTDAAGNLNLPGSIQRTFDSVPPSIEISAPNPASTITGPVAYLVTYTEANSVTLTAANITLNRTGAANGAVGVINSGPLSRVVSITNITGEGSLSVSIAAGTASDAAGNLAPAAGPSGVVTVLADSDGDGIPDSVEGNGDPDGDGIPNFLDLDSDGDGLLDADEGAGDPDQDGTPNFLDLDSDNDNIPDRIEAQWNLNPYDPADALADPDGDGLFTGAEVVRFGSNPFRADTDRDGMPDGFEAMFLLKPSDPTDAPEDPDNDGLTNREEYELRSDPRNPRSPYAAFFVSPTGSDSTGAGTFGKPWRTIPFALSQVQSTLANPSSIVLAPGIYDGNLTLTDHIILIGAARGGAILQGPGPVVIEGAANARLRNLEVRRNPSIAAAVTLLRMSDVAMRVQRVVFRGGAERISTGIVATGLGPAASRILRCEFRSLAVGIDIAGGIPRIGRCLFDDLSQHAILLRDTIVTPGKTGDNEKSLGDVTDVESGFNIFGETGGAAVRNESDAVLNMQNNDWNADDPNERIEGPSNPFPVLPKGSGAILGSIVCEVVDAVDSTVIINDASVDADGLPPNGVSDGFYTFILPADSYRVTAQYEGYTTDSEDVDLEQGDIEGITLTLFPDVILTDSDGDGIPDERETNEYGTDPFNRDTDNDDINDDVEIRYGSDPLKPDLRQTSDVNKDGARNAVDVQLVILGALDIPTPGVNPDVNRDGSRSSVDVQTVILAALDAL